MQIFLNSLPLQWFKKKKKKPAEYSCGLLVVIKADAAASQ